MNNAKQYSLLLTFALLMSTLAATSAFTVVPTAAQAGGDWPMFRFDAANTGYNPDSTGPSELALVWQYNLGLNIKSSAAVVSGKCYVGCDNGYLYCLDANDGSLVWKYQTGGAVRSSPAVVGGKVYFGSFDNNVYCLDANSGSLVWKYTAGYWVLSSPTVTDGKVFITSNDRNLYCLDASTGTKIWNFSYPGTMPTFAYWNHKPAVVNGKVFMAAPDNYVYCLDEVTGAKVWGVPGPYSIGFIGGLIGGYTESSPCVVNGVLYVGGLNNYWAALNTTNGGVIWSLKYNQALGVAAPSDNIIQNSAAFAYGNLYVIWPNPHMAAVENPATGMIINMGMMGQVPRSSLAIADNKAYCGNNDRYLYVWNAADMSRLESVSFPQIIEPSPAVANGKVYVGCADGIMRCFGQGQTRGINNLNVDPQPRILPLGSSVTVSGGINVFHGTGPEGQTMTIHFVRPDGSAVTTTTTTGAVAAFSSTYTPDAEGEWKVKASWDGNPWWLPSESYYQTFTVTAAVPKTSTTISASVSNTTIVTGSSVTVSGAISPEVDGVQVTLTYTKPGGGTVTRTSVSAAGGAYTDTYKPDTEGSWTVTSNWAGNDKYQGATSSAASFTVSAAEVQPTGGAAIPTEVIYAIVAIIVIAIVVVIAYWYMKRPKK